MQCPLPDRDQANGGRRSPATPRPVEQLQPRHSQRGSRLESSSGSAEHGVARSTSQGQRSPKSVHRGRVGPHRARRRPHRHQLSERGGPELRPHPVTSVRIHPRHREDLRPAWLRARLQEGQSRIGVGIVTAVSPTLSSIRAWRLASSPLGPALGSYQRGLRWVRREVGAGRLGRPGPPPPRGFNVPPRDEPRPESTPDHLTRPSSRGWLTSCGASLRCMNQGSHCIRCGKPSDRDSQGVLR